MTKAIHLSHLLEQRARAARGPSAAAALPAFKRRAWRRPPSPILARCPRVGSGGECAWPRRRRLTIDKLVQRKRGGSTRSRPRGAGRGRRGRRCGRRGDALRRRGPRRVGAASCAATGVTAVRRAAGGRAGGGLGRWRCSWRCMRGRGSGRASRAARLGVFEGDIPVESWHPCHGRRHVPRRRVGRRRGR